MEVSNPFLIETKTLYRHEYEIAKEVVELISDKDRDNTPVGEIGFIALHIHSAITSKNYLRSINIHSLSAGW